MLGQAIYANCTYITGSVGLLKSAGGRGLDSSVLRPLKSVCIKNSSSSRSIVLSYAWYKDTILNFIRPNVRWYTFVSSDGKLYFQFVTSDDEGDYYCVVTRPNTMDNFQEGKISMPIPLRVTETGECDNYASSCRD